MATPDLRSSPDQKEHFLVQFGFSLVLAGYFIGKDLFLPWSATLVVLVYGAVLFVQIRQRKIAPTEHVNDSPYFLGFLLTLVALFVSFSSFSSVPKTAVTEYMIRAIGAAIATTIAGLAFRVVLVTTNPIEQKVEELVRSLQDELRINAARFKEAQLELLQLVEDYTDSQKIILATQQEVSQEYVSTLKESSKSLKQIQTRTIKQIESSVSDLASMAQAFNGKSEQVLKAVQAIGEATQGLQEVCKAGNECGRVIEGLNYRVGELQAVLSTLHARTQTTEADLKAVDFLLTEFIEIVRGHLGRLASIR